MERCAGLSRRRAPKMDTASVLAVNVTAPTTYAGARAGVRRFVLISSESVYADGSPLVASTRRRCAEAAAGYRRRRRVRARVLARNADFETVICGAFIWGAATPRTW